MVKTLKHFYLREWSGELAMGTKTRDCMDKFSHWVSHRVGRSHLISKEQGSFYVSTVLVGQIDPVMKHVPVYILYIRILCVCMCMSKLKSYLPDHLQIHVPIRWRCNHEITYTHHMRLHTTMQVLGRHQAASLKMSKRFQSQWSCRPCLDRINPPSVNHVSGGLTSEQ